MSTESEFHCALCGKAIELKTELKVDQVGRAVHHKCYTENLDGLNTSENYVDELWIALYRAAMVELESGRISGRIDEARKEAEARIKRLGGNPSLHKGERNSIADALYALNSLSRMHESDLRSASAPTQRGLYKIEPD
jgi:hypothetical protein